MKDLLENYVLEGELLNILSYPEPILVQKAITVESSEFNDDLKTLCQNMLYTMYKSPGIGLAAPQIGIGKRIFVIDTTYSREETEEDSGEYTLSDFHPMVFINPEITHTDGSTTYEEGCLSLPGIYEDVKRFEDVTVTYQDLEGNKQELNANELLSICIQHENDHLDGIVFIDRLSMLKKKFLKKKLIKAKHEQSHNL